MILMQQNILDVITSFDETCFGIFNDEDQEIIKQLWDTCKGDRAKFISYLSPSQKIMVSHWMSNRITYSTEELVKSLEKFTKYLKSSSYKNHDTYPKKSTKNKKSTKKHFLF